MQATNTFKQFKGKDPFNDILGQLEAKHQILSALMMNRHIILVGPPGIGKTTLAKNISKLLPDIKVNDCPFHCNTDKPFCPECKNKRNKTKTIKGIERFIRIQGSPDLTVEDLLGDIDPIKALKFGPLALESFTPGKIFKANQGVLFFDELNRCPEKLQNALLQVLEEGKATIGSYTLDLEANFIFIGSLHPEEEILIGTKEGFMKRVKIGNFIDQQITKYGYEEINSSHICPNFESYYAFSYNPKSKKIEKLPITSFIRHQPTDFIYEIKLSKGRATRITGKHSVFTENNNELKPIEVSKIKVGDKIAIPNKIEHICKEIDKINLLPFFASLEISNKFFVKGGNIIEIIENNRERLSSKMGSHTIANSKYFERLPLGEAINSLQDLEGVKIGVNGSSNLINSVMEIDTDLCWLLGFIVAEGFPQKAINNKGTYRYNLIISNKNIKYLEKSRNIIEKKFGVTAKISLDKRTMVYNLTISCMPLYYVITKLFEIKKGSLNKKIPSIIFQLNEEKIKHFLDGYIKGDGNYYTDKNEYTSIKMATVSKDLANDLSYLFLRLGKILSIKKVVEKRKNHNDCYHMYLCQANTKDIFEIKEDNNPYQFEKVIAINKLKTNPVYVYDLEVLNERKTDNFIGGFGGVLLHNTMNPEDFAATEKLSEVLLDRFDLVFINYPENVETEKKIIEWKGEKLEEIQFPESLLTKTVSFIQSLRKNENLERVPSVRATLGLYERAQSNAYLKGKKKVDEADILDAFYSVIAHRIRLKPSIRYLMDPKEFIKKEFEKFHESSKDKEGDYP